MIYPVLTHFREKQWMDSMANLSLSIATILWKPNIWNQKPTSMMSNSWTKLLSLMLWLKRWVFIRYLEFIQNQIKYWKILFHFSLKSKMTFPPLSLWESAWNTWRSYIKKMHQHWMKPKNCWEMPLDDWINLCRKPTQNNLF